MQIQTKKTSTAPAYLTFLAFAFDVRTSLAFALVLGIAIALHM